MLLKLLLLEFLLITLSEQGLLPSPPKYKWRELPLVLQRGAPIEVSGLEHRVARFENMQRRKTSNIGNNDLRQERREERHRDSLLESEYDINGMVFLSKPINTEDRDFNALINKVVEYKMNEKNNKYLRHPPQYVFTTDEIQRLKNIVDGIENDMEVHESLAAKTTKQIPPYYMDLADLIN